MCLTSATRKPTNKTYAKLRREKTVRYFKVYKRLGRGLSSLVFSSRGHVHPGRINSSRKRKQLSKNERKYGDIEEGIHVLVTRAAAELERYSWEKWNPHEMYRIVEAAGKFKDLVAVGQYGRSRSAVFMSIDLSEEEYRKAIA